MQMCKRFCLHNYEHYTHTASLKACLCGLKSYSAMGLVVNQAEVPFSLVLLQPVGAWGVGPFTDCLLVA